MALILEQSTLLSKEQCILYSLTFEDDKIRIGYTVTIFKLSKPMKLPWAHSLPCMLFVWYYLLDCYIHRKPNTKTTTTTKEKNKKKRSTAFYGSLFSLFFFRVFVKQPLTTDMHLMPSTMPLNNTECINYEIT